MLPVQGTQLQCRPHVLNAGEATRPQVLKLKQRDKENTDGNEIVGASHFFFYEAAAHP